MTTAARTPTFEVRHVQLARAAFAALAAVMITFSPDHSALIGTTVFSGFAVATGLVLLLAVWLVYPAGLRWPAVLMGTLTLVAGMVGGLPAVRTIPGFFALVIIWAALFSIVETVAGVRALRAARGGSAPTFAGVEQRVAPAVTDAAQHPLARSEARDGVIIGALTLVLAVALLCVPRDFELQYTIEGAPEPYTLTGIIIGVGIFGGYAAILAVYLAIAGFSPRAANPVTAGEPAAADQKDHA